MGRPDYLNQEILHTFIDRALEEDVGNGDISTLASVPEGLMTSAKLIIKDEGILAGMEMASIIYNRVDPALDLEIFLRDGAPIKHGDIGFRITGQARAILKTERLVLNCMQRMSGIATKTRQLAESIKGTKARIKDTRKTTPSFRIAEKWAVSIGGGENHRFGLFDMVMLKDNHIDIAGGIKKAIQSTIVYLSNYDGDMQVEVETRNLREVNAVLEVGGVDIVMLDNMSLSEMKEAVKLIDGQCLVEASGSITAANIRQVADCGVDFISVGALTHSYNSLDMSLKVSKKNG